MAKKKPGVPYANAQTHSEALLEQYLDSPEVREKRAKEALEAAIKRDNPEPKESPLTPAEQMLRDFYADPKRREEKAQKALEEAIKREVEANKPAAGKTPSEEALADFYNDPERREAKAKKALEEAQKREHEEQIKSTPAGALGLKVGKALSPDSSLAALGAMAKQVVDKFAGIIGPSAVLGQILNSTVSGFGVLQSAVKVFASTIAPVLLPATIGLSATFLALSEVINEHQGFIDLAFDLFVQLIPVLEFLVDTIDSAAEHIEEMADAASMFYRWILSKIPFSGVGSEDVNKRDEDDDTLGEDKIRRGLNDSLQSLRQSIGPKASSSGLNELGKAVQLAAFNTDPLEARLMRQQLDALNRIENKIPRPPRGRAYDSRLPGDGDFSGDEGAGGSFDDGYVPPASDGDF